MSEFVTMKEFSDLYDQVIVIAGKTNTALDNIATTLLAQLEAIRKLEDRITALEEILKSYNAIHLGMN